MTGEERLEALIVAAVRTRGWTRAYAESNAWAWLSKESGVMVRWEFMTAEQRWAVEAALEKHDAAARFRRKPRTKRFEQAVMQFQRKPEYGPDWHEHNRAFLAELEADGVLAVICGKEDDEMELVLCG